jgi:2-polyprenyl-3-methyl-5-hydroxy-6-metoxy-1,4-benzoquinol methylase
VHIKPLTLRRIVRGVARRAGLHRVWAPGIRPYRVLQEGREFISCHACGANGYRVFIRDPHHQVVRCPNCGLYYVNPTPTPAELSHRVQESAAYTEDQLRKKEFFRRRAQRLLDHVETLMRPGRLLDIGCSIGTQLQVAQERRWKVTGIELAASSVRIAREAGFEVRTALLTDAGFATGSFDLITMNHVLEHVAHTPAFMREVHRVLADDGFVFISLPNVHAWKFYFRRGAYAWTFHEDHYIHFSPETLKRFLEKYGFQTIEISTSRWLDFHDPLESRSWAFQSINNSIERLDMGIEIFCLARKTPGSL